MNKYKIMIVDDDPNICEIVETVAVHISNLRKKIEPDPANLERIVTIRGAGYMLVAEVR